MSLVSIICIVIAYILLIAAWLEERRMRRTSEDIYSKTNSKYAQLQLDYSVVKKTYCETVKRNGELMYDLEQKEFQIQNQKNKLAEIDENKRFAEDNQIELQKRLDECQKLTQKKRGTKGTSPLSGIQDQVLTDGRIIEASTQNQGPSEASEGIAG